VLYTLLVLAAAPALATVAPIVRASHENWDGSGYPDGLKGEEIPLAARIIAACDAYNAMTSDRPYRTACSPREARRVLVEEAGSRLDAKAVTALFHALDDERGKAEALARPVLAY